MAQRVSCSERHLVIRCSRMIASSITSRQFDAHYRRIRRVRAGSFKALEQRVRTSEFGGDLKTRWRCFAPIRIPSLEVFFKESCTVQIQSTGQ
jgi:hypothetical protein